MAQGSAGFGRRRGGESTLCEDEGTRIGWVSGILVAPLLKCRVCGTGRVHGRFLDFASCSLAAATTLSGVKPNFLNRSLAGAEPPKPFMAILAPSRPT